MNNTPCFNTPYEVREFSSTHSLLTMSLKLSTSHCSLEASPKWSLATLSSCGEHKHRTVKQE